MSPDPKNSNPPPANEEGRLRNTVSRLVHQQEQHASWLRSIEEKLRATREQMLSYQAAPRR